GLIDIRPRKRLCGKRNRGSMTTEHRVDQNPFTIGLKVVGGMAKPDQYIFGRVQLMQICFYRRYGVHGFNPLAFSKKKSGHHREISSTLCKIWCYRAIGEGAIFVIRGVLYALQATAG